MLPMSMENCFSSGALMSGLLCSLSRAVELIGEKKLSKAHSLIGRAYKDAIKLRGHAYDELKPGMGQLSEKLGRFYFESAKKLSKARPALKKIRDAASGFNLALQFRCS